MRTRQALASSALAVMAAALFGATTPPPVQAQTDEARSHFQRGRTAYRQGAYEQAIEEWSKAYELDPQPLLQFNLAQAYERLGQLSKAVKALERYLETAEADDANQATARAKLAALKERLSRTGIHISGGVDGSRIEIDGEGWGRLPRPDPIKVRPGRHTVRVTKSGYDDFRSDVVVPAGQVIDVSVELEARPSGRQASETYTASMHDPKQIDWLPYGLIIGGGVAIVTGAVLGGVALSNANGAVNGSNAAETARGLAIGADIAIAAGLVAGGAGLVLLLTEEEDRPTATTLRVAPRVGPQQLGLQAAGRF